MLPKCITGSLLHPAVKSHLLLSPTTLQTDTIALIAAHPGSEEEGWRKGGVLFQMFLLLESRKISSAT